MSYEVFVTDKACHQLEAAALWWAQHRSVEQAERWYDEFIEALRVLEDTPQRFALARENDAFPIELRQLMYGLGRKNTHRAIFTVRPIASSCTQFDMSHKKISIRGISNEGRLIAN